MQQRTAESERAWDHLNRGSPQQCARIVIDTVPSDDMAIILSTETLEVENPPTRDHDRTTKSANIDEFELPAPLEYTAGSHCKFKA